MGVEEKIDKADVRDAVVVVCSGLEGVVRYQSPLVLCFVDKCDFSQLSASDWISVLSYRPELAPKFESVERDWDKDDEFDPLDTEVLAELSRENP